MASIAKISIDNLNSDSDAELIVSVSTALTAIIANILSFATPTPTAATVQAALDAFIAAINAAQVGGPEQTAIKDLKRAELVALFRLLAFYVTVTCNGDMAMLLSSGMPVQQPSSALIGPLVTPNTPVVRLGPVKGTLSAKSAPVRGAGIYNWRVADAAAPTVFVQTAQTPGSRVVFSGLTPGVVYNIELNAVGAAGTSNWSDDGSLRVV
jgi:hypothetical protein